MIQVRKGVFETNSSSTHAIVIAREGTKPLDRLYIRIGEYGWERDTYHSPDEKASYFYTLACDVLQRDVADEMASLLAPYGIDCNFEKPALFEPSRYYKGEEYLTNGYVDHAYEGKDLVKDCLSDVSLLIDFIFNDKSYVETGNDNDDEPVGEEKPDCKYVEYYKGN